MDKRALADFLEKCQFKYGGLSKAPGERPGETSPVLRPTAAVLTSLRM